MVPEYATTQLPSLDSDDLRFLKAQGWARVGIVSAVAVEVPDAQTRLLMLQHRPSDKTPGGAWGPLAETAQLARSDNGMITVERTAHTLSRALREEVGVADPMRLQLTAKTAGSWVLNNWPIDVSYANQWALAVCPVVYLDDAERERLQDTFVPTEEITAITFMTPEEIVSETNVRPGTHNWARDAHVGLTTFAAAERTTLELPSSQPLPGAVDIKLGNLSYL